MLDMRKKGATFQKISEKYGVSRQRIQQICSTKEWRKRARVNTNCIRCAGLLFGHEKKFCAKCRLEGWKMPSGGLCVVREQVRIRDNWTCQICTKKWEPHMRRFDVHHEDADLEGMRWYRGACEADRNNLAGLITLCHKCHLNLPHVRTKMSLVGRNK